MIGLDFRRVSASGCVLCFEYMLWCTSTTIPRGDCGYKQIELSTNITTRSNCTSIGEKNKQG